MKEKILIFFLKNYKIQKWASLFKTFKNVTLRNDIYLEVKMWIWIDPAFSVFSNGSRGSTRFVIIILISIFRRTLRSKKDVCYAVLFEVASWKLHSQLLVLNVQPPPSQLFTACVMVVIFLHFSLYFYVETNIGTGIPPSEARSLIILSS